MGKKKGEVKEFKPKEKQHEGPTAEEIEEQMRKDEEEMNERLAKFASVMPQNANSEDIDEETEEEEDFTISFNEEGKMIATQKFGEGTIVKDEDGKMIGMATGEADKMLRQATGYESKPDPGSKYGNFMRDLLVRKAIAKLLKETRDTMDEIDRQADGEKNVPVYLRESLASASKEIEQKKIQLQKSIRGNKVHYEDIPEWAVTYIEEYIELTLTNLILLGEE